MIANGVRWAAPGGGPTAHIRLGAGADEAVIEGTACHPDEGGIWSLVANVALNGSLLG